MEIKIKGFEQTQIKSQQNKNITGILLTSCDVAGHEFRK